MQGRKLLKVFLINEKTNVCMNYRFYHIAPVVRFYAVVTNISGEEQTIEIPIVVPEGKDVQVECIYPKGLPVAYEYDSDRQVLRVSLEEKYRARLFKLEWCV